MWVSLHSSLPASVDGLKAQGTGANSRVGGSLFQMILHQGSMQS